MNLLKQYYQSASCCCLNCPCGDSPPGFTCQPYHLPGYLGHVPTMRGRFGSSYSRLTRDSLQDPCAPASPCPMLLPEACIRCPPMCCNMMDGHLPMKGQLAPRGGITDIYRNCESMNESYSGHVPGFTNACLEGNPSRSTPHKIYLHNWRQSCQPCYQRCDYDEHYCCCMDAAIAAQKRKESEAAAKESNPKSSRSKSNSTSKKSTSTPTNSTSSKSLNLQRVKSSKSRISAAVSKSIKKIFSSSS